MKNVTYRKKDLISRRGRAVSILESLTEKDCDTRVHKSYVYLAFTADEIPKKIPAPEIFITKKIDAEAKQEVFVFRVKGVIFTKHNRFIYRVEYSHGLVVRIQWKTHVLSSKPADPARA